jgi:hypothetical protein
MKKHICFILKQLMLLSSLLFFSSCEGEPQMPTLSTIKEKRGQDSAGNTKIASHACKTAQQQEESARAALSLANAEIAQNSEMLKICFENSTDKSLQSGGCEHLEKKVKLLQEQQQQAQEALRVAEEKLVAECN